MIILGFLNSKEEFINTISKNRNLWIIPNFGIASWKSFLYGIVHEIGAEIDEPVTIDIHRLIRYPGSLHGATGFKVQELGINELNFFNPLNENNEDLDPIIFKSKRIPKIIPKIIKQLKSELFLNALFGICFSLERNLFK